MREVWIFSEATLVIKLNVSGTVFALQNTSEMEMLKTVCEHRPRKDLNSTS